MATLPQALLLLALHDEKGTIHPAAYLGIDHGLRGAVLAELQLQKLVQTRKTGGVRMRMPPEPLQDPLLDRALEVLRDDASNPGRVSDWLGLLEARISDVRRLTRIPLTKRGILEAQEVDRDFGMRDDTHFPMVDGRLEAKIVQAVRRGVQAGPGKVGRRVGHLIALIDATNLVRNVFDKELRQQARAVSKWVKERDPIATAVEIEVSKSQGTWEG